MNLTNLHKKIFARLLKTGINRRNSKVNHYKQELFSAVCGTVLEVGAGTGVNCQFFKKPITHYYATEPNTECHAFLKQSIEEHGITSYTISESSTLPLPFESNSMDYVISTLVFCSAQKPEELMKEIYRVLKPHGSYLFIEHVLSKNTMMQRMQKKLKPLWSFFTYLCQPDRDTTSLITSIFPNHSITHFNVPSRLLICPHIVGKAQKNQHRVPVTE